ncbi:unnamed protein product, partial [Iphiclides podalirius]
MTKTGFHVAQKRYVSCSIKSQSVIRRLIFNMKGVTILCFVATLALSSPSSENLYTDRYDSINLDEILSNRRLLIPYVNCLLEKGKCTPEGNELKSHIREAMENDCAKCTAAQRRGTNQDLYRKMKSFMVLCLFAVVAFVSALPSETYTDRYDNVNLDEIIANRRLLVPYLNCILDKGKCTADGKELKSHISEAVENDCAKCTDAQRKGTRKVIGHLINHEKEFWDEITAKYDPTHKYTKKYETELRTAK